LYPEPSSNSPPDDALIRLDEVLKRIPVSKFSYYQGQKLGLFPAAIRIGPRASAYRYSEVRKWLENPEAWQREHKIKE
jgi:predicted DNA-binding transcriptional regulator AlpA